MLRKQPANKSGFTIIEVVITIAIGAAVMALVLNAVAGARRSQRNNARAADVNAIAAGVNQYIATRNALPTSWSQVSTIIDHDKFGHYETSSINELNSWSASHPAASQVFVYDTDYAVAPAATTKMRNANSDNLVVINKAKCNATNKIAAAGGIREMVIIYKLEGQADTICLEV